MAGHIFPAFVVAGTCSGCGKTTVSLGIMSALRHRGNRVQPFKCGPDFIDPTLHRFVTGTVSRNLDIRMCGREFVRQTFYTHCAKADIAVVEGVMGLFDGGAGSAAELAAELDMPVLLVVDASSAAESVAAVIHGFESFDVRLRFAGVVLNNVAGVKHEQLISKAVSRRCMTDIIGVVPRDAGLKIPERHLGLFMGDEQPLELAGRLADVVEHYIDLEGLCQAGVAMDVLARSEDAACYRQSVSPCVKVAVARDRAFCFYYEDNLDIMRSFGAEIKEFSILNDREPPSDVNAIYIGGGYPELHADEIAANRSMLNALRRLSDDGVPILAECGGFMLLAESLEREDGNIFNMAGVFPVKAHMNRRVRRLGYRQVTLSCDTPVGKAGDLLYGHEFHYSDISSMPERITSIFSSESGIQGWQKKNTVGSYMHFHFGRTPGAAERFVYCGKRS